MRALLLAGAAGLLLAATPATSGHSRWYWGIEAGAELGDGAMSGNPDLGIALLGTIGTQLGANFALEGEIGYRSTNEDGFFFGTADVSQVSLMLNGVYEMPLSDTATLALGIGFGINDVEWDYAFFSESDSSFSGQLKLGLVFDINERMDLVTNIRHMTSITDSNGVSDVDNTTITIGLRFDL